GYLALWLGCRSRAALAVGLRLETRLPEPLKERTIPFGAILLLVVLGMTASYGAFRSGIIGFALPRAPRAFDAAISYAGILISLGHFLFWFRWFDPRQKRLSRWTLALPVLIVVLSMVVWGNRGILLSCYLVAAFAFRAARGRLSLAQNTAIVALAFGALFVGMVYGSMFRRLKGGETGSHEALPPGSILPAPTPVPSTPAAPAVVPTPSLAPAPPTTSSPTSVTPPASPSLERQFATSAQTAGALVSHPRSAGFSRIFAGVGQRLNLLSDVSVTVARYPELRASEAAFGITDLWTMTWTGFVPRAFWPGKPRVSDARAYAELYFGWGGNSYATSPPADLLRNGGPLVLPLGMALLGFVLGVLTFSLGSGPAGAVGERAALSALLLLSVNLEGSYGLLLPTLLRTGLVVLAGLAIVRLWSFLAAPRR
ncbi:MAG: hypothetical protein ABIT01_02185, partial [Thermoanaerobaculia bacterium]